ncbi:hypothetical protein ACT9XH_07990 [Methanococcoides methylutens]|uniref:hypothetical protein n=1 Tax=Methanococcoides methylutens TaxID=2226 RepID=UPI004044C88E
MRINLEPIGIIKKAGKYSEILIYSEFEQVVKNLVSKVGKNPVCGQELLIVHKNGRSDDVHQVEVTKTTVFDRVGNILKVGKINAHDDSVIDVRIDVHEDLSGSN